MRSLLFALLAPALAAPTLTAQAYLISPGSRVRIMKQSERYEPRRIGVVVNIAGDSAVIRLQTEPPTTETFALARLERYNGNRTRARDGMLKGGAIGAGIGFALATAISDSHCGDAMFCLGRQQTRLRLTPVVAIVGMVIGHARGSRGTTDRWVPLIKPEPSPAADARRRAAGCPRTPPTP